jgi:hypothetical protein
MICGTIMVILFIGTPLRFLWGYYKLFGDLDFTQVQILGIFLIFDAFIMTFRLELYYLIFDFWLK